MAQAGLVAWARLRSAREPTGEVVGVIIRQAADRTNDTGFMDSANMSTRLDAPLDKIAQASPSALIVLAQIAPFGYNSAPLTAYNAKILSIVQSHAAKGQHVVGVDMSKLPVPLRTFSDNVAAGSPIDPIQTARLHRGRGFERRRGLMSFRRSPCKISVVAFAILAASCEAGSSTGGSGEAGQGGGAGGAEGGGHGGSGGVVGTGGRGGGAAGSGGSAASARRRRGRDRRRDRGWQGPERVVGAARLEVSLGAGAARAASAEVSRRGNRRRCGRRKRRSGRSGDRRRGRRHQADRV